MTLPFRHRRGTRDDFADVTRLERRTARLFAPYGLDHSLADHPTPTATLEAALDDGGLFVTEVDGLDRPAAFLLLSSHLHRRKRFDHVDEVHVDPELLRRGIGRSLMALAESRAAERGACGVTLVTLDYVPWNAPFYRALGYRVLARHELSSYLEDLLGVLPGESLRPDGRIAMRKDL